VPTIVKTIGAAGDYANVDAIEAAWASGYSGASGGDHIVWEFIDNTVYVGGVNITANPNNYASLTIRAHSSIVHNGTAGSGPRWGYSQLSPDTASVRPILGWGLSAVPLTVEPLEFIASGGDVHQAIAITAALDAAVTHKISRAIIHGNGQPQYGACKAITCTLANINVLNCLIYDWKSGYGYGTTAIEGPTGASAVANIIGNTIDDIDDEIDGTVVGIVTANHANKTVKNNLVTLTAARTLGTKTCFSGAGGSTTASNNASSDSTAPGSSSVTSIVRGNTYTNAATRDYSLISTGQAFQAGVDLITTPAGVNIDIKGRDRDSNGDTWSIGAHQLGGGSLTKFLTILSPNSYQIFQRDGSLEAAIPIDGLYAGSPTGIEYRLTPVITGTPGPWTNLGATIAAGQWSGTLPSMSTKQCAIDVRQTNDTSITAAISYVGIGEMFVDAGQSNMAGAFTNDQTYSHATWKAGNWRRGRDSAHRELIDPSGTSNGGSVRPLLATLLMAHLDCPVGFVSTAESGTGLVSSHWDADLVGNVANRAKLCVNACRTARINGARGVLWLQGENDAITDKTRDEYRTELKKLATYLKSNIGGNPPLIAAQIAHRANNPDATDAAAAQLIRLATSDCWDDGTDDVLFGPVSFDVTDQLHPTTNGMAQTMRDRWYAAILQHFYGGADGRGPSLIRLATNTAKTVISVFTSKDIAVPVGSYATAPFVVESNGSPVTVSSVARVADRQLDITLATPATGSITVSFAKGSSAYGVTIPRGTDAYSLPLETFSNESSYSAGVAMFTEFCCRNGGSNLNAGTVLGDGTVPSTSPVFSTVNGNWDGTSIFTPTDGSTPASTVSAGMMLSVFLDAATVTPFIARIVSVAAGVNGAITVSTTAKSGTPPASGATGRSARVGGAFKGPNGAEAFPMNFITSALTNAAGDLPRINYKNDATYAITAAINNINSDTRHQGFTNTYDDRGKATLDGGTSGASYNLVGTTIGANAAVADFIFQNNGATGTAVGCFWNCVGGIVERCVAHDVRGSGFASNANTRFIECEAYNSNQSNTTSSGGFSGTGALRLTRCFSHDNAGSNGNGVYASGQLRAENCVFESNAARGVELVDAGEIVRCDFYNNASDGLRFATSSTPKALVVENSNFVKNGGWGVLGTGSGAKSGVIRNCGFGAGSQANTSGNVSAMGSVIEEGSVTYVSNQTPWVDPANGDFRVTLTAAKGAGRGNFTQTAASYTGTVAYPDIGAAQHLDSATGSSGSRLVGPSALVTPAGA